MAVATATLSLAFGLFKLANLLNISYYYVSSQTQIVNIVIFSQTIDWAIWAFSLLIVLFEMVVVIIQKDLKLPVWTVSPALMILVSIAVFFFSHTAAYLIVVLAGLFITCLSLYYGNGYLLLDRKQASSLTLSSFAGMLILIEAASAVSWISNIFSYQIPFGPDARWIFPTIDQQLFNSLYPLAAWLLLLFLYSWIWIPILKYTVRNMTTLNQLGSRVTGNRTFSFQGSIRPCRLNRTHLALGLLLTLIAGMFIAYYPNFHTSGGVLAGSDSGDYYGWLQGISANGTSYAVQTDRPLALLLMYSIQRVTGVSTDTIIKITHMVLVVLLSLAIFWFVEQGTKDERLALIAAAISTFSFQTVVGVFAYFAANWLAIIESLIALVFLLKAFEKSSWKWAVASTMVGFAVLLTHPYTWDVLMVMLVFLLIWTLFSRIPEKRFRAVIVLFLLGFNLLFYAAYDLAPFGKQVSNGAGLASGVLSTLSVSNFLSLANNFSAAVQTWLGGLFSNSLLILLALIGAISLFQLTKTFNKITLLWIIVPSLAILAVSPDPYYYRFLYIIPIQIQAATGLQWIINKLGQTYLEYKHDWIRRTAPLLITILILLFLLNYAMRSVDTAPLHFT